MDFKNKIYNFVRKVPTGKVATYKSVASVVGSPRASRAVANALAKNFDSKIPCHRVIRSDGFVGGYNRGGPKVKAMSLKNEGVVVKNGRIDTKAFFCFLGRK
jgi:O-6-methylguanine DNA methyltransferase